jgi:hypothetical protein
MSDGIAALGRHWSRHRVRWLLALCLAAMVAVNTLDLPLLVPRLRAMAGGEAILDMRPGYDAGAAHRLLEALGSEGRLAYLRMLWTVDLLLPALFTLFLWSAVSRGALRRWRWVTLLAGAADLLENVAITSLLLRFPHLPGGLVSVASTLTLTKFSLYLAGVLLAASGARRRPEELP